MKNFVGLLGGIAGAVSIGAGASCMKPVPPENPVPVIVVDIPFVREVQPPVQQKTPKETEDILTATKDRIFEECFMEEPHKQCTKDENHIFFELADKLHPDLRQTCTNSGNYNRDCLDRTFQNVFSGQIEYDRMMTIRAQCKYLLEVCMDQKLAGRE